MRNNFNALVPFVQIVDDLFSKSFSDVSGGSLLRNQTPALNILELEKEFKLELAAPGLDKADFKIHVENNFLNISAEKKETINEEKENYRRREFSYHSFKRSFELPQNVQADNISAKYENGILNVSIPKSVIEQKQNKTIEIA
ncbi:MAG: Hsp20/alpha crystallin family protein [Saprospiraceae bacterium]|nr:Hsp20/alpha crystallin family protein [Saprospiraceae bacterium]